MQLLSNVRSFFEAPILNSPYDYPAQHWELDESRQPTGQTISTRRPTDFITPIPKPRKRRNSQDAVQQTLALFDTEGISDDAQAYDLSLYINSIREKVSAWRDLPGPSVWKVTPTTEKLLQHWRHYAFEGIRPFFCQVEAVETAIWLAEVAPKGGKREKAFLEHLQDVNGEANPNILRVCMKLATGAGKTTVMAMLIAWQTLNSVRHPNSQRFTKDFLIVTPGITIRDRLQVLKPNDANNYYSTRDLVPSDMVMDLQKANIVITNYHAFKLRERVQVAAGTRKMLQGRGPELETTETEGQMIQRVMGSLGKNVLVINDEAHHCYREKPGDDDEPDLTGDDKDEAKKNSEAARLWIFGLEAVQRKLGVMRVYDLSATPFFLRGSGYAEGTLFPWTVSDFSLMDAIECGIVKLPRVPVADNVPGGDMPKFRNLWEHIGKRMPKKGRGSAKTLDPLSLPKELCTALDALYGHYVKTFELWQERQIPVPPVFIVVCNNTSTSKLVYDYISGFYRETEDGSEVYNAGRLELFRNYDEHGNRLTQPKTLLIDSEQLESGDALDKNFRDIAAEEIERFRYEIGQRDGAAAAEKLTDQDLLREVMNTVGKEGKLGAEIRCVVSVSMLTEGWDTNTVTHVLGVRAFGTQLLCEQVIGRALRRYSYELSEDNLFDVEYADVFGIPFDFTAKPVVAKSKPPKKTTNVKAVRPERDALEITFPNVQGYRVELPDTQLTAAFSEKDSTLELTPNLVGATITQNSGIIGESVDLNVKHLEDVRESTVAFELTRHLIFTKYRDPGEDPKIYLFGQLKRIARQWMKGYLKCIGGTYPAQLMYREIADMACDRIKAAITEATVGEKPIKAVLDAYNPTGTTAAVNFNTSKETLWQTDQRLSHINWVVCDSDWEAEFCRVVEGHLRVKAYVKNQGLGFEVPYLYGSTPRKYIPDFIVLVDDGHGPNDLLNLVVEIKGYRGEDAKDKASTMRNYWVPGVNNLGKFGRWQFAEFTSVFEMDAEFQALIDGAIAIQAKEAA
jgi:type III restriction enzyme